MFNSVELKQLCGERVEGGGPRPVAGIAHDPHTYLVYTDYIISVET